MTTFRRLVAAFVAVVTVLASLATIAAASEEPGRQGDPPRDPSTPGAESAGQIVVDRNTVSEQTLGDALEGPGLNVTAVTATGALEGAGLFDGFSAIGFDEGLILSSGHVTSAVGPNTQEGTSGSMGTDGDALLSELVGQSTYDASVLQVSFVPTASQVAFDYVFASEEYNEYVGSSYNDVFSFQINGVNCATVEDEPVSVNAINNGRNSGFYRDNAEGAVDTEFDGLTTVLTCRGNVTAGATNTLRLAIADASDDILDSGVFLRAGSLTNDETGSIRIVEDADPDDAQDFGFVTSGTGLSPFTIDDDPLDDTLARSRTFAGLAAGTYTIGQPDLPDWYLAGLTCNTTESVNLANRTVTITLAPAENVVCTFTNSPSGSIRIVQDTVPDGGQDFSYTTTGTGLTAFVLDDDADGTRPTSRLVTDLAAGAYSVTQPAVAGWTLRTIVCDTGEAVSLAQRRATITLTPGEDVTCTFTDARVRPDALVSLTAAGPYAGDGLYTASPTAAQTKTRNVTPGTTTNAYVRLQNDGSVPDTFLVRASETGSNRYTATYFHGSTNITTAVRGSGYTLTNVPQGGAMTIRIRFVAAGNALRNTGRNADVTVTSTQEPTRKDVVRARVRRV